MIERQGLIKFHSKEVTVIGKDIQVGQTAPDFHATTQDWEEIEVLKATQYKVRIITALPSLDTEVCDRETRRFNQEAADLSEDILIIAISTDLPFTQKRWCGMADIKRVTVVSDHLQTEFGEKYACLLKEPRILRRAVFVIDKNDKVTYVEYTPELGVEPDYKAVLRAARNALA